MSALGSIVAGGRPFRLVWPAAPIRELRFELLGIAVLTALLLSVAVWNGFPIIFYDTGAYMLQGLGHAFLAERSPIYSNFLLVTGGAASLWFVAAAQCLICGFVMTQFARALRPEMSLWMLAGIGAVLCVGTGLPWYAGQIEPDVFVGLVPLAFYLFAFHRDALGGVRSALLVVCAAIAIACHSSHVALAAGLVVVLAALRFVPWFGKLDLPRPRLALSLVSFGLAITAIYGANYAYTGDVFFSRSGAIFQEARMMEDGLIQPVLATDCPAAGYAICPYRDQLPTRADTWLWMKSQSPFQKVGGFASRGPEAARLVRASLERYPLSNLVAALQDSALQFFWFQTGDGIVPQQWVLDTEFKMAIPQQLPTYTRAYQQEGEIWFLPVNLIHVPVAVLSLGAVFYLLRGAWRRRDVAAGLLPAFVLLALIGNAIVCGVFSGPHGRYQSRIMWLPTFAIALIAAPRIADEARRRFGLRIPLA